jgi:hypothetical protein
MFEKSSCRYKKSYIPQSPPTNWGTLTPVPPFLRGASAKGEGASGVSPSGATGVG